MIWVGALWCSTYEPLTASFVLRGPTNLMHIWSLTGPNTRNTHVHALTHTHTHTHKHTRNIVCICQQMYVITGYVVAPSDVTFVCIVRWRWIACKGTFVVIPPILIFLHSEMAVNCLQGTFAVVPLSYFFASLDGGELLARVCSQWSHLFIFFLDH
jgi:hypothetical protein